MKKRSLEAFLARGFDSITANNLIENGYNITNLKCKKDTELKSLGLTDKYIKIINSEPRPPIPQDIVNKLIYDSKFTCCICRDRTKGIIIHHIEEWHESKNHNESNLVVLCLEHHDLAHTTKGLTINLKKDNLIKLKQKWLDEVKTMDAKTILNLANSEYGIWNFFNHGRVFELFFRLGLSNDNFFGKSILEGDGRIHKDGTFPILNNKNRAQIYDFADGYKLRYYMSNLFEAVLGQLAIIDITDKFTKHDIRSLLNIGDYIAIQAGFYFKELTKGIHNGVGQYRLGYYQKQKLKINFQFDAYETTSNSARAVHLCGHKIATCIGKVNSIIEENGIVIITLSCLGIGCYFNEHEYRKNKYTSNS